MSSDIEKNIAIEKQANQRKPYHSPQLSSFGTVTQLTQTSTIMMKADGGPTMGGMNMVS